MFTLVNSVNPFRIEGQKTGAFEVCDQLGEPPDVLCIPVGNAGNVTAWARGFQEEGTLPRLHGYQAAGAAPLVEGQLALGIDRRQFARRHRQHDVVHPVPMPAGVAARRKAPLGHA